MILPEVIRKAFTEEVTPELDLKQRIWKEGEAIPRKEMTQMSERGWCAWRTREKPHLAGVLGM